MERGTVSMRVAFVLRSAEVQPLFRDLCELHSCNHDVIIFLLIASSILSPLQYNPPYNNTHKAHRFVIVYDIVSTDVTML
jgi:hypothetical protein